MSVNTTPVRTWCYCYTILLDHSQSGFHWVFGYLNIYFCWCCYSALQCFNTVYLALCIRNHC